MSRRLLNGLLILVCLSLIASECYAWPPEPDVYISDWHKYTEVGEDVEVYAEVVNYDVAGPIDYWDWTKPSALYFSGTPVENDYDSTATFYSYTSGQYTVWAEGTDYYDQSDSDYAYVYVVAVVDVISGKDVACIGENVTFGALTDPPNCAHLVTVTWTGGENPPTGSGSLFVTNWSTPGTETVTATCGTSSAQKDVTVVEVDKVVKSGTTDEGPLYPGCPGTSVTLEAKPNPAGTFPAGEPHWTLQKPDGSSATLSTSTGYTTTLSGTDKWGNYVVTAKCGNDDTGDSITVAFNLGSESVWYHYTKSGEVPIPCLPYLCDGEDTTDHDDCGNELEVSCCQEDGTGGVSDCAYRYFYNDKLISSCIWITEGDNYWLYKEATIQGTSNQIFTKMKHINSDEDGNEGCDGYYCTKIEIYNCLTGASTTYWRRDPDSAPLDIDQGIECPGH